VARRPRETEEQKVARLLRENAPRALEILAETMEDDTLKPELRIQCCKEILSRYDKDGGEGEGTVRVELCGETQEYAK